MTRWHCAFTNIAIHLNNWRIIPRVILLWYFMLFSEVIHWFIHVPNPSLQQAGVITVMLGSLPLLVKFYLDTGSIEKVVEVDKGQQNQQQPFDHK